MPNSGMNSAIVCMILYQVRADGLRQKVMKSSLIECQNCFMAVAA